MADSTKTDFNESPLDSSSSLTKTLRAKLIVAILVGLCLVGLPLLAWMGHYIIRKSGGASDAAPPLLIFTLLCLGAIGGMLSSLWRIYGDETSIERVTPTDGGQALGMFTLVVFAFVPAISGAVSSLMVFLVFMSGFVKGVIFPEFHCRLPQGCSDFGSLINDFGPLKAEDYAKCLLWGFLSGFSERLLPNFVEGLSLSGSRDRSGSEKAS